MITKLFTKKNKVRSDHIELDRYLDQYYGKDKMYYLEVESEDTIYIVQGQYGKISAKYARKLIELELDWEYTIDHPQFNPKVLIIKRRYRK